MLVARLGALPAVRQERASLNRRKGLCPAECHRPGRWRPDPLWRGETGDRALGAQRRLAKAGFERFDMSRQQSDNLCNGSGLRAATRTEELAILPAIPLHQLVVDLSAAPCHRRPVRRPIMFKGRRLHIWPVASVGLGSRCQGGLWFALNGHWPFRRGSSRRRSSSREDCDRDCIDGG